MEPDDNAWEGSYILSILSYQLILAFEHALSYNATTQKCSQQLDPALTEMVIELGKFNM